MLVEEREVRKEEKERGEGGEGLRMSASLWMLIEYRIYAFKN